MQVVQKESPARSQEQVPEKPQTVNIIWECWLNNHIDRFIDMKGRAKEHRQINHFEGAGNTASFPSKSCKPVSLRKVVTFNQMCF